MNALIRTYAEKEQQNATALSPLLGNVLFASGYYRFSFTLHSFASVYASRCRDVDSKEFAKRLWGDLYFNKKTYVSLHRLTWNNSEL